MKKETNWNLIYFISKGLSVEELRKKGFPSTTIYKYSKIWEEVVKKNEPKQ